MDSLDLYASNVVRAGTVSTGPSFELCRHQSIRANTCSRAAAVHHLTRVLAKRLAPNITVNAVAPGPFESKMMAETIHRFKDAIIASCPLGRIGEPEDMAGVTIYLASRAGAYVTGMVICVDGGISI